MRPVRIKALTLMLLGAFASSDVLAFDWSDLWQRPDQRAYELLQQGDSTTAAEKFTDPQWRGVSHYRAGDFEQAQKEFSNGEGDAALYNQGVTAVQQGEFDSAIEKFESLLNRSPDHADGQHNLEIARELAKQQEQQEQQQGDQQEEGDQSQDDKQQDPSESEGEGQSQQSEGDSGDEQGDSEGDEQRGGELTAEPDDAASDGQEPESDQESQSGEQGQDPSGSEQQPQQQQGEGQDGSEDQEQQASSIAPAGPSESEQATEQWLRRIPDDPSQLLRNKIKLNHMIEHSDVQDMQEPW